MRILRAIDHKHSYREPKFVDQYVAHTEIAAVAPITLRWAGYSFVRVTLKSGVQFDCVGDVLDFSLPKTVTK